MMMMMMMMMMMYIYIYILYYIGNKGHALDYIRCKLNIPCEVTMCSGDSGNDISMFAVKPNSSCVNSVSQDEEKKAGKSNENEKLNTEVFMESETGQRHRGVIITLITGISHEYLYSFL